ncbi:MAG: Txe/YoeB family addiction module toxin [Bacteroidota bacterium]
MDILFTDNAWEDFEFWVENDADKVVKIKELLKSIRESLFKGLGKPEPLKHGLKGYWSRRIDHEHRLVYRVQGKKGIDQTCIILQCRFHYDD